MFRWQPDEELVQYIATLGPLAADAQIQFNGWNVSLASENCMDVTFILTKGAEVHFFTPPERNPMPVSAMLKVLAEILQKYGFASTRLPVGQPAKHVVDLGFVETWCDGTFSYFNLTELPVNKGQHSENLSHPIGNPAVLH